MGKGCPVIWRSIHRSLTFGSMLLSAPTPARILGRCTAPRALVLLLAGLPLAGCGWVEDQRQEAAAAARAETLAEVEAMLGDAVARADRIAGSADRILSPLPVKTPGEEAALRRFLSSAHVASAARIGVRVRDEETRDSLVANGRLIELEDSTTLWIVRERSAPAYVTPEVRSVLTLAGQRFQERLAEMDLPPYRFEVTSALRTSEHQARLRRGNANAAAGVSSHEFGATVDLSYAAFAPPEEAPPAVAADAPSEFRPHLERIADLALESVSARKSRELGKIFSAVLRELQDQGLALVIYERQQTVYHVTATERVRGVEVDGY